MDYRSVRESSREPMKRFCRLCSVCDGRACAGQVPGMGGAITGSSFSANTAALHEIRIHLRVMHGCKDPSTKFNFLGNALDTPIMGAPMTGAALNCGEGLSEYQFVKAVVEGSQMSGSIGFIGDAANLELFEAGLRAASEVGKFIAIIKPRNDPAQVIDRFRLAEDAGAVALGMDLDGAGLITMRLHGQPVGPKTPDELKRLRDATKLPFIVKGIMTPDEAQLCVDTGADAIVVSNHGGRTLDGCPGVAEVLYDIAGTVKGKCAILADGSVRSGVDAFKLIALGADGVLVGRPLCWGAFGGGSEGVATVIKTYTEQLYQAMIMTGCPDLAGITEHVLF